MYLIEGHWETINDVSDIVRIIRDNYNYELADILQELAIDGWKDERERLEDAIDELECEIDNLEDENYDLENQVDDLGRQIEELEDQIDELKCRINELESE